MSLPQKIGLFVLVALWVPYVIWFIGRRKS